MHNASNIILLVLPIHMHKYTQSLFHVYMLCTATLYMYIIQV